MTNLIDPLEKYSKKKVDTQIKKVVQNAKDNFTAKVQENRGDKIVQMGSVFEGEIYTGQSSVDNGLADEIGNMYEVIESLYPEATIIDGTKRTPWEKIWGVTSLAMHSNISISYLRQLMARAYLKNSNQI